MVITFENITKSKVLEAELSKIKLALEQRIVDKDNELLQLNNRLMDEVGQGHREVAASKDPENKEI